MVRSRYSIFLYRLRFSFNRVSYLFAILQKRKYHFCEIDFEYFNRLWANETLIRLAPLRGRLLVFLRSNVMNCIELEI